MDREKVIKGLETCSQKTVLYVCGQCPYNNDDSDTYDCTQALSEDALALLKEQKEKMEHLNNITLEYEKEVFRLQAMLKEQEAVEPKVSSVEQRCGNCNKVIEMDGWQSCPWCGKRIDWKGWWKKNDTRNQDTRIVR